MGTIKTVCTAEIAPFKFSTRLGGLLGPSNANLGEVAGAVPESGTRNDSHRCIASEDHETVYETVFAGSEVRLASCPHSNTHPAAPSAKRLEPRNSIVRAA
jgi:hypothetical protein